MKIGLYSPYWDTMGGGEKYMLDLARCFPEDEIVFFGAEKDLMSKAKERFGFSHKNVSAIFDIKKNDGKLIKDKFKNLDLFFYQCDGSIFIPSAKKNILLIQSPVHSPQGGIKDKIKLFFWQKIICNSEFTAKVVRKKTGASPAILNPAVDRIPILKKENIILSVGRFFPHLHSKKQEVLIEIFKKLTPSYRLCLVGAVASSDREYLKDLKEQAKNYQIDFFENVSFEKIRELYGSAKIFWHAAGYGEDLKKFPERAEHFGIATIEAISAGCYPLVFKAGGQKEILGNNPEFYWETKEELLEKTKNLITNYELPVRNASPASHASQGNAGWHSDAGGRIKNYEKKLKIITEKYLFESFKKKLYEIIQ